VSPRVDPPGRTPESGWRRAALAPLVPIAALYGSAAWLNRVAYTRGGLRRARLPCPVIAVGSLMVGGTGKTPLVAWLAAALRDRGHRVAVLSRGYARRSRARHVVSDGERVLVSVAEAGDEPLWLAGKLPGIPVIVAANRAKAGREAIASFGADMLLLDDGLQHHRLRHDLGIATFDATVGLGNGWVLPRGPLREPARALRYADAAVLWRGPEGGAEPDRPALAPGLRSWSASRRVTGVRALGDPTAHPSRVLEGAAVGVISGLANPASLRASVARVGARVVAERQFPDHHAYRPSDLRGLSDSARIWVTSEKDALKIEQGWLGGVDLRVLVEEVEVEGAEAFLDWIQGELRRRRAAGAP